MTHRIGPDEVTFDIEQEPNVSRDKLTIRSQGRFMTAKANTCVYGGKWQFEVSYSVDMNFIWVMDFLLSYLCVL